MRIFINSLLLVSMAGLLYSCSVSYSVPSGTYDLDRIATDENKIKLDPEDLPIEIEGFLEINYSPIDIETAFLAEGLGYEIRLEDGQDLYFTTGDVGSIQCLGDTTQRGAHLPVKSRGLLGALAGEALTKNDLPRKAKDYISDNYSNDSIRIVSGKPSGKFVVQLSDGTIMLFSENGVYVKTCGVPGIGFNNWGGGITLDPEGLPAAATFYISNTYPGVGVEMVSLRENGNFFALLFGEVVLIFDEKGQPLFDGGS